MTIANANTIYAIASDSSINTDDETLTLQLSKSVFDVGDLVVVEGSLEDPIDDYVQFSIYAPGRQLYKSEQLMVEDDELLYLFKLPVDLTFIGEWQITAQFEKDGKNHVATELFNVQNPYDDDVPLRITDIEYKKALGQTVSMIQAHKPIMVSISVSNDAPFDQPFTSIIEIINSDDTAVFLSFQTDNLASHDSNEYGFSWTPEAKGKYLIRVLTIKSLDDPVILSDGSRVDVIVL